MHSPGSVCNRTLLSVGGDSLPHFPWESRIQEFSSIRKFNNPVLLVDIVMTGESPVVKMLAVSKLLPIVFSEFYWWGPHALHGAMYVDSTNYVNVCAFRPCWCARMRWTFSLNAYFDVCFVKCQNVNHR